ncbi:MAG: 3-methyl-2-oxobutanoate hydroxymethyltransferase [Oscillatoria sp. PMC 1051.18]|uniref:3-methyl-2-oxobutanoate hydroxymethyltransferase n=1 Tax=Oscillatoria salina TaxID=331517 RepID=UPI0013B7512F|nr:3-methyl-2-oxobutanoate hydroxymethyltransferase [Oscillatoria salina]MBZ8180368.1 3-methyl-2-oxobutanoate hydroxymethyltransferase [Oscillatoria salina IIICB1]MEC4892362.1 3-methyl-2-oxobutanoate hydroxymethyltransferase [Oscillatoria sp. PMC 1050.18]MEC5029117.1 3-methyl-2-oxobutanoate hydroxymethyltransferase [Oscillatoria sp. PMC 1051.18]NET87966.1 3-methyl-2-oxobutanoate hydroxymethyltransferase [Kamptonema sp. SIO1D9]
MSITIKQLIKWKQQGREIVVLTAWDYPIAEILDEAGVDLILVGDSLATVALGHQTTLPVTLDQMIHHAAAVCRGVKQALVVCDLPFLSYQESAAQALHSAGRILKETNAKAIKLEGGYPAIAETVAKLTTAGIPVMGHVGLTPQSVHRLGYKQQGNTDLARSRIMNEAIALAQAGAFAIILEHIPHDLAAEITAKLAIPTIGIGAGVDCDGQVLVTADLLGLTKKQPPFAKTYTNLRPIVTQAVENYAADVRSRQFPKLD